MRKACFALAVMAVLIFAEPVIVRMIERKSVKRDLDRSMAASEGGGLPEGRGHASA